MEHQTTTEVLEYATSLVGAPFRWYDPDVDSFNGTGKFWCENSPPPSANEITENDASIACTGFVNLLRRKAGLRIPGLNGNIKGKHKEYYKSYPGGTGAWWLYLFQRKRLEKLDMKRSYPKGTLLLARYKDIINDQGHGAVVYADAEGLQTINDQLIIHSNPDPDILYLDRDKHKNHGSVKVEKYSISNDLYKYKGQKSYYTYVCLPENWLLLD